MMRTNRKAMVFFLGLLLSALFLTPLMAAEGMKVRMNVDGLI